MKKIVRQKTLSEQVGDAISAEISSGGFVLGQMLSETMISEKLGVSRTPVREAFSHLEKQGLVKTVPKKGTFVFDPSPNEVRDLFEVSTGIELQGLRAAMARSPQSLENAAKRAMFELEQSFSDERIDEYQAANTSLHNSFVGTSGNPLLISIYGILSIKIDALSASSIYLEEVCAKTHEYHRAIVNAIVRMDFNEAETAFRKHLAAST